MVRQRIQKERNHKKKARLLTGSRRRQKQQAPTATMFAPRTQTSRSSTDLGSVNLPISRSSCSTSSYSDDDRQQKDEAAPTAMNLPQKVQATDLAQRAHASSSSTDDDSCAYLSTPFSNAITPYHGSKKPSYGYVISFRAHSEYDSILRLKLYEIQKRMPILSRLPAQVHFNATIANAKIHAKHSVTKSYLRSKHSFPKKIVDMKQMQNQKLEIF